MIDNPYDKVPTEHIFHFVDGKKAHNLKDLYEAIKKMDASKFSHHVDSENNDFANWVEFVYKNSEVAKDLRQVTDKKKILEIIGAQIGKYQAQTIVEEKPADKKQLHEEPAKVDGPSQVIKSHDGEHVHTISTEAAHKFVLREFLYGAALGLIVGFILAAILARSGVF